MVFTGELYVENLLKPVLTLVQTGVPCKWVHDSQRFLLEFFDVIHNSPSQIYHYALPFSPSSSWLHKCYAAELSQEVKVVRGLSAEWGACSRTVTMDDSLHTLACWKDTIAVGSESWDIILLDAITGSQMAILSEHTDCVSSLTFFPDGTSLVSGSEDKTLKLWDIQTGGVVKTFHGHTNGVCSTSISSDCTTIASGSADKIICLWDIQTGECHHIIEQQEPVYWVCFSPTDPQHLISASGWTAKQWDINGHQIKSTYEGGSPAFSPNGTCFVLCRRGVAVVRNSDSGAIVAKCPLESSDSDDDPDGDSDDNPEEYFYNCCFSPDGGLVAIAAPNTTYVWDITGSHPCLVETVTQECDSITSITFSSSSLITASNDRLIKFWQIGIPPTDSVATNTLSTPLTSAAIESTTLQAKDSIAISSDSAGVVRVWDLSTGLCKAFFQTLAKGNTNRDAQMIEGRLIFVWHRKGEGEIHIWDIEKGEPLQTVEAHSEVKDLRISGDGSKVFCLNGKLIQAWSLWTGEAVGEVKVGYLTHLPSVHAYTGGSRICVHSHYSSTQEWDFGISGSSPVQLSNTSSEKLCQHLVWTSWSDDSSVIEDTVTGEIVFQLFGRHEETYIAQWDGQYLVAGYRSGEVLILDRSHLCV
jgi:WD40 repeat protein